MFTMIASTIFYSFRNNRQAMIQIFEIKMGQVIKNAELGRGLSRIITETTFMTSTFYGNEQFLKNQGQKLIKNIDTLVSEKKDVHVKKVLKSFSQKLQDIFNQCILVNQSLNETKMVNQEIENIIKNLNDTLSDKIMDLIIEEKDTSLLDHLPFMVAGYNETILQLKLKFAELGLEYFKKPLNEKNHPLFKLLDSLSLRVKTLAALEPDIAKYGKQLSDSIEKYRKNILNFHTTCEKLRIHLEQMKTAKEELLKLMEKKDKQIAVSSREGIEMLMTQIAVRMITVGGVTFIIFIFVVVFSYFLSRSISSSLARIIDGLQQSSQKMSFASDQVLSASNQLSSDTYEYSTSLEQTSSSLEQMASMTSLNSDNAMQTDNIGKDTVKSIQKAAASMNRLIESMKEISQANEETVKIITTIDEIAFQTNLLSLNAAVEAARAGETGAGFAVVADEVRNLAMRSAKAAQNTSLIIKTTTEKIKEGADFVSEVNTTFINVEKDSEKILNLVSEVASSSKEQARGIKQINCAVAEMDKIVQKGTASSKKLSISFEDMNIQVKYINELIQELAVIGGKKT